MKAEDIELYETIEDMLAQGKDKKEIQEALEITPQKYGLVMKAAKENSSENSVVPVGEPTEVVKATLVNDNGYADHIKVETAKEYRERHDKAGTPFGRKEGQKTKLFPEELRILIKESWTDKQIMAKHGISKEELGEVATQLSRMERDSKVQILKG